MAHHENVRRPFCRSPSSRRAWIEILIIPQPTDFIRVALLAEGVDRNYLNNINPTPPRVALLAEGVDRNPTITQPTPA